MASYAGHPGHPGQAEVAFAVADHMHHKGIATLLLEHLVPLARSRQITTFTAETLIELVLRVSRLADDLPEVTELDLNPVIARPHGVFAMDARIKVTPCPPQDPFFADC